MIVVRLSAGLGNQMFQYALGRILAIKNNTSLVLNIETYNNKSKRPFRKNFSLRTYDLDIFKIKARIATTKEIPALYRMYFSGQFMLVLDALRRRLFKHKGYEDKMSGFNEKFLNLKDGAYLDGFFQSPRYFTGYESELKSDFTFKQEFASNIKNLATEIENSNSLCVFFRRTDYVGNKYHEVVNQTFYDNALSKIKNNFKIDKVYVFSDDLAWCRANVKIGLPLIFVDNNYAGQKFGGHMYLMSKNKYFIIPNSTFAWWGAWLSNREGKVVFCPKEWFVGVSSEDYVLPEWIRI